MVVTSGDALVAGTSAVLCKTLMVELEDCCNDHRHITATVQAVAVANMTGHRQLPLSQATKYICISA